MLSISMLLTLMEITMLRKIIFTFVVAMSFASGIASAGDTVLSPEMQCIRDCIGSFGWDNADACVEVCTG